MLEQYKQQTNEYAFSEEQLEELYQQVLSLSKTGDNSHLTGQGITLFEFVEEQIGSTAEEIAAQWDALS